MSKQTHQGWFMIDEPTTAVPVTHARTRDGVDRLIDAFVFLIFIAPFGLAATLFAWLDIGYWSVVLTWSGSISVGALLLGLGGAWLGDRRDRACRVDVVEERYS